LLSGQVVGLSLVKSNVEVSSLDNFIADTYGAGGKFVFKAVREYTDDLGMTHIDYKQYCNGIEVQNSILIVHLRGSKVVSITGEIASADQIGRSNVALREDMMWVRKEGDVMYCLESGVEDFDVEEAKEMRSRVRVQVPMQRVQPEEFNDYAIVEHKVNTFYSGEQTLRMTKDVDGNYFLVDPERCTYTLEGLAKSDLTPRDITSNAKLAEHTTSFIKNAQPKMDADGDWDFFVLKQAGVLGYEEKDGVDLDTCRFNYIFTLEKNGKWLYGNQTYGAGALVDTVPPAEIIINYRLERDSTYTLKVKHRGFGGEEILLFEFDFVANESGRISFPSSLGVDGYYEISRVPNHALDVHYAMNNAYVYYKEVHGHNSFDGNGAPVYAFVDFNDPVFYGEWTNNAAASSIPPYFVAVGSGSKGTRDLSNFGSFDLLAHEYAHLVAAASSRNGGLNAEGESGALNEGIADCMSVAADFYINKDRANWQIADGVTGNGIPNMRDLSDPKMSGGGVFNAATLSYPQPNTYGGENWVNPTNMNYDNGGIHFNNGVLNYWFYLLTEGGQGINDNSQGYNVVGIGIEKTEKLMMRVILNYLYSTMNYAAMRIATQQAAIDLWGEDSDELEQVKKAWYAVGVADRTPIENVGEDVCFNVYSADSNVIVEVAEGSVIEVYNIVGQLLDLVVAESGMTTIEVATGVNVVVVKVGNLAEKVLLK
jgi:Zn-dependent metalloprotease